MRLQFAAFFKENSEGKYNELATVKLLQDSIIKKNNGESKRLHEMFKLNCEKIYSDFSEYVKKLQIVTIIWILDELIKINTSITFMLKSVDVSSVDVPCDDTSNRDMSFDLMS